MVIHNLPIQGGFFMKGGEKIMKLEVLNGNPVSLLMIETYPAQRANKNMNPEIKLFSPDSTAHISSRPYQIAANEVGRHLPWERPLHMQPNGRLHKSERNMGAVLEKRSEGGTVPVRTELFTKSPFDGQRSSEDITIVRFIPVSDHHA
jgi:hypothetical protein